MRALQDAEKRNAAALSGASGVEQMHVWDGHYIVDFAGFYNPLAACPHSRSVEHIGHERKHTP